ncbi:MAG: porin family protein [Chitinophagales bacterium]
MKKIASILTILLFLTNANAQELRNFRFGLVFSNAIMFPASDNVDLKSKPSYGFDYGLSIDYFFTDNYAISSGIYMDHPIYARSGTLENNFSFSAASDSAFALAKGINSSTIGNNEKITSMNLNIPLSFKLKTNEIGYFKYFGDVGILNSFRIQSRYSLKGTDIQKIRFGKENAEFNAINYHTKTYNFSLKIGGGIEWTISDNTALLVGLYFYNGFIDYIEDNDAKATYIRKLSLRTGILF